MPVPPSSYAGGPCAPTDLPMSYFDNLEGAGGVTQVYSTVKMAPHAKAILFQVWSKAGLDIRAEPPSSTTFVVPHVVVALSPQGPIKVTLQYLLLTPLPYDQTEDFWERSHYLF